MGEQGGNGSERGIGQREGKPEIKGSEVSPEQGHEQGAVQNEGDAGREAGESRSQPVPQPPESDVQGETKAPEQELGPEHAIFTALFENMARDEEHQSFFTQATQELRRGVPFETILSQQELWLKEQLDGFNIPHIHRDQFRALMRQALDRAQAQHSKPLLKKLWEKLFGRR